MQEEELLAKLKLEFEKSNQLLSEQDAEINILKEQKESLTCMIKEEKNRSSILEQQKISLQQTTEEALKKEVSYYFVEAVKCFPCCQLFSK